MNNEPTKAIVYINGYGLKPIQVTKIMTKKEAMDMCEKENHKLVECGVPAEEITINPSYHFFRIVL